MPDAALARTPLAELHRELGGRMVEFAGWEMPVQYSGVQEEHRAVREAAGLFDVSHMGEIAISGPRAVELADYLTPNHVAPLEPGRAQYTALLTPEGTYVDDLLLYRLADDELLLVVNAANREADFEWVRERAAGREGVEVEDVSDRWALLALQGPRAEEILAPLTDVDVGELRYYRFERGSVDGRPAIVSRTGYTGEDGFELYVSPEDAEPLFRRLLEAGADAGLVPAGLGARDTLRLEAALALYGHEIDRETTPWEARLGWTVKLDAPGKEDFVGREALVAAREAGPARRLVGFEIEGRGIARQGHAVVSGDERVGEVTSGTWSPTLGKALGLAYVDVGKVGSTEPGTELAIEVRGRRLPARIVETPFYRRPKKS